MLYTYNNMVRNTRQKQKQKQHPQATRRVRRRPPVVESHRFISSMTYDGNRLITKSQKDNEPVKERVYTMKQLKKEIPIGKEMIDMYLDGKMPQTLQDYNRRHDTNPTFNNVLLHPADLGLLPPTNEGTNNGLSNRHSRRHGRRNRSHSHSKHDDDLRLMVVDHDHDHDHDHRDLRQKHLFDLP